MIKDYSRRGLSSSRRPKKSFGREGVSSKPGRAQKIIGIIMITALVAGFGISLWMGQGIRESLHNISDSAKKQENLTILHESLLKERDLMMARKKIEMAAMDLGLFQPSGRQILRP